MIRTAIISSNARVILPRGLNYGPREPIDIEHIVSDSAL
jgi:hypothetical protein